LRACRTTTIGGARPLARAVTTYSWRRTSSMLERGPRLWA
jgi:hypothetical protein